jgi:hypothetical protein
MIHAEVELRAGRASRLLVLFRFREMTGRVTNQTVLDATDAGQDSGSCRAADELLPKAHARAPDAPVDLAVPGAGTPVWVTLPHTITASAKDHAGS